MSSSTSSSPAADADGGGGGAVRAEEKQRARLRDVQQLLIRYKVFKRVPGTQERFLFEPTREQTNDLVDLIGPAEGALRSLKLGLPLSARCMSYNEPTTAFKNGDHGHLCEWCGTTQTVRVRGINPTRQNGRTGQLVQAGGVGLFS